MALLMEKCVFQIDLSDTEFVIFTELFDYEQNFERINVSDQDPQENVLDNYPLSKLFVPSVA